jgi:hypothetical protein
MDDFKTLTTSFKNRWFDYKVLLDGYQLGNVW